MTRHVYQQVSNAAQSLTKYRFIVHEKPVFMMLVGESGVALDSPSYLCTPRKIHDKSITPKD